VSDFESAPAVDVVEEALGLGRYVRVLTLLTCQELPDADDAESADYGQHDWRDTIRGWELDGMRHPHPFISDAREFCAATASEAQGLARALAHQQP
jgi:hypothetical protein